MIYVLIIASAILFGGIGFYLGLSAGYVVGAASSPDTPSAKCNAGWAPAADLSDWCRCQRPASHHGSHSCTETMPSGSHRYHVWDDPPSAMAHLKAETQR